MIYYLRTPLEDFTKRTSLLSFVPKSSFKEYHAKLYILKECCTNLRVKLTCMENSHSYST